MSKVLETTLDKIAREEYYAYGIEVIEDRAIVCDIDGLKPVTRRSLWAAHKLGLRHNAGRVKAALLVGETMGKYHPHGDSSILGAIVTANNAPVPMFDGEGNWGSMTDDNAGMRYIETRLSKYSDKVFFDKFYLPSLQMVDNYDDSRKEPLVLVSLLPNILLNGNFGIAPGVRTETPSLTLKSLSKLLLATLKAGACTPKLCIGLEHTTVYGGVLRNPKGNKKELLEFYKTGKGRFLFDSVYEQIGPREIRFNRFSPISDVGKVLGKIQDIKGVKAVRDDSNKSDKFNAYVVSFGKLTDREYDAALSKVVDAFSGTMNYNTQITKRFISEAKPNGDKQLEPSTVCKIVDTWLKYRIQLEKTTCKYWIGERQKEIDYLNLMRLAVKNRKIIIQALDKKFTDEQLAAYLAKKLKITVDKANIILDLKVRSLKSLEDNTLVKKIKALKEEIGGYKVRIAKPKAYIAKQIKDLYQEFKNV